MLPTMIWQEEIHKCTAEGSTWELSLACLFPMSKSGVKNFSLKKNKLMLLLVESVTLSTAHVTQSHSPSSWFCVHGSIYAFLLSNDKCTLTNMVQAPLTLVLHLHLCIAGPRLIWNLLLGIQPIQRNLRARQNVCEDTWEQEKKMCGIKWSKDAKLVQKMPTTAKVKHKNLQLSSLCVDHY